MGIDAHEDHPSLHRHGTMGRSSRKHAVPVDAPMPDRRPEGMEEMQARKGVLIYCKTG